MSVLVTLVSYCSNERDYIRRVLDAAIYATDTVCVAFGNRLYDGSLENTDEIAALALEYPTVGFSMYDVPDDMLGTPVMLHNLARKCAMDCARKERPDDDFWVLMLDADEVPRRHGTDLRQWREKSLAGLDKRNGYKLTSFWYFLAPNLVSQGLQDSMTLVHSSAMTEKTMSSPRERDGICYEIIFAGGEVVRHVYGLNGEPMFDHFAWVRGGRDGLLRKVANWGHSGDKDWTSLITVAFDSIDRGEMPTHDFIHAWTVFELTAKDAEGHFNLGHQPQGFYVYHTLHL